MEEESWSEENSGTESENDEVYNSKDAIGKPEITDSSDSDDG